MSDTQNFTIHNYSFQQYVESFFTELNRVCANKLKDYDFLFAAVYLALVESGFSPIGVAEDLSQYDNIGFDMRRINAVKLYPAKQMERIKKWCEEKSNHNSVNVYIIEFSLGCSKCTCELQGIPSEDGTDITINCLSQDPYFIKSTYLQVLKYVNNENMTFRDVKGLLKKLHQDVIFSVKSTFFLESGTSCFPHILGLPEFIQKNIFHSFNNAADVLQFSATCSYLRDIESNDKILWQCLFYEEFSKVEYNQDKVQKELESSLTHMDGNIFRKTFIHLQHDKRNITSRFRCPYDM